MDQVLYVYRLLEIEDLVRNQPKLINIRQWVQNKLEEADKAIASGKTFVPSDPPRVADPHPSLIGEIDRRL